MKLHNAVFVLIVGAGGYVASIAEGWWSRTLATDYNPALIMAVFIGIAFMARGLIDPR